MNRFFIELYLDEDVDVLVADLLRARGFVATTTRDAGKLQASDAEQMACSVGWQETLLTHNRADFEALARTYYPGTEEAHTNPTCQRGECLRALAGASGSYVQGCETFLPG